MRESEMEYTAKQKKYLTAAVNKFGADAIVSNAEISELATDIGMAFPYWLTEPSRYGSYTKVGKNSYKLPDLVTGAREFKENLVEIKKPVKTESVVMDDATEVVIESKNTESVLDMSTYFNPAELIPAKDPLFVAHGHFSDLVKVLKSGKFYPVFETGESGTGKTYMTEQACAKLKREFIRDNITVETDEDDDSVTWDGDVDVLIRKFRKEKYLIAPEAKGFNEQYLILGGKNLEVAEEQLEVAEDASVAQLARAFKKFSSGKLEKRKLLSRFIDMVAA